MPADSGPGLCERCAQFDFQAWFFPAQPVDGPTRVLDKRLDWKSVGKGSSTCSFCRILLLSLLLQPSFKGMSFTGDPSGISLSMYEIGTVTCRFSESETIKQPEGPGWVQGQGSFRRAVRHLSVCAEGGGRTVRSYIYAHVDESSEETDNILLSRSVPGTLDLKRVHDWVSSCKLHHAQSCDPGRWTRMTSVGLRMIDLQNRCITTPSHEAQYCALSYCWGTKPFLRLTSKNSASLCENNSLSKDRSDIPDTVKDAMDLAIQLGARFLWVDALCIVQDDAADKAAQLPLMDRIYKHSMLTIVAATGDGPFTGLTGLRAGTREVNQVKERVGPIWLYSRAVLSRPDVIAASSWSKRAWTLQEHALSPRLLIFTPTEVFWECNVEMWGEGAQHELCSRQSTEIDLKNQRIRVNKAPKAFTPFQRYAFLINQASARQLSFERDKIDCLRGLLDDMSKEFPGGFVWGHPVAAWDSSLLFNDGVWSKAPLDRRAEFPSWSWAGWHTVIVVNVASPYDAGFSDDQNENATLYGWGCPKCPSWIRREVAWFLHDDRATEWKELQAEWIDPDGSAFYAESKRLWQQSSVTASTDAQARLENAGIPLDRALAFWTQSVQLSVDRKEKDKSEEMHGIPGGHGGSCRGYPVRDHLGRIIGFVNLTEEYRRTNSDKLKFILVAQNRRWDKKLGPLLDLLHVETVADVTFRVQVIRDSAVRLNSWVELEPSWEFVVMA